MSDRAVEPGALRPNASYLLTGGLGGPGLSAAQWMVEQGARHLVLAGLDRTTGAAQATTVEDLKAAGAQVTVARIDVANRKQLSRVLDDLRDGQPPLRGVIHLAGALDDSLVVHQDAARFPAAMAREIDGAWNLHELTRDIGLDFFVMFSSAASHPGSPGQASSASAHAFLDALAHHRRANGLPAKSVHWGAFCGVGRVEMDAKSAVTGRGPGTTSSSQELATLERLFLLDIPQITVVPRDRERLLEIYPAAASSLVWSEVLAGQRAGSGERGRKSDLATLLERAAPEQQKDLLEGFVVAEIASVIHLDASRIDAGAPLTSLGMDSLMGLELRNRLQAALGVQLSAALLWKYPTARVIAEQLLVRWLVAKAARRSEPADRAEDEEEILI